MTELTNEHFELHDHNKAKLHKTKKFGVALSGLNNQINKLIKLTPTDKEIKLDENGNWQTTINPKYLQEQLSTITDDLTDVLVDLKIQTGIDI